MPARARGVQQRRRRSRNPSLPKQCLRLLGGPGGGLRLGLNWRRFRMNLSIWSSISSSVPVAVVVVVIATASRLHLVHYRAEHLAADALERLLGVLNRGIGGLVGL